MRDRINEYPIIRDLIRAMGFTLECGPNVDEVCFTDGMRGYVYLKYYHHRILSCSYSSPMIEAQLLCDTHMTKGEKMQITARSLPTGDCLLEFRTSKGKFQVVSLSRVPAATVRDFNTKMQEELKNEKDCN